MTIFFDNATETRLSGNAARYPQEGRTMTMLLVAGAPGSGKTTLAKRLGERLGWPVFSKDAIKERLFDTLGFQTAEEKNALGAAAVAILQDCGARVLAVGGSVILESNFEARDEARFKALAERVKAHAVTVLVDAETDTLYERFVARETSPDRHRGHTACDAYPSATAKPLADVLTREAFERSIEVRGMRRFVVGDWIPVDTTDPGRVDIDALIVLLGMDTLR